MWVVGKKKDTNFDLAWARLGNILFTYNISDNLSCASCGLFVKDNFPSFLNCKTYKKNCRLEQAEFINELSLISS